MTAFERAWRGGRNGWRLQLLGIFSIAVAFVCLVSALVLVTNVSAVRDRWASAGRASVYLRAGASEQEVNKLIAALEQTRGVRRVRSVSSSDARAELLGEGAPDPVLAGLPVEAFPASLELAIDEEASPERLEAIVARLGALSVVDSVETYESWTERLGRVLSGGMLAAGVLAFVVLAAVASVVASIMRLSLQRRASEVEILKLVGATDRYVRQPFVVEGALQGALGAALALVVVGALYLLIASRLEGELGTLLGVAPRFLPAFAVLGLVAGGAALGALAARASLRRLLVV